MQRSTSIPLAVLVVLLVLLGLAGSAGAGRSLEPLAPAAGAPGIVSYQGQVTVGGAAYSGTGYFRFAILDGSYVIQWSSGDNSVQLTVTNGLFNVLLGDTSLTNMAALSASAFNGTERYLRVWFSSDNVTFTPLEPDRRIAAAPYALQAEEARNAWSLAGNAGTSPGANFLGTSDNQVLELKVNGARALRIEPNSVSPNVVGGWSENGVTTGVFGATIGGGGRSLSGNNVTDNLGTVGGGEENRAGDNVGTTSDASHATVGGGGRNEATGLYSTIGGGHWNAATKTAATVGGGSCNGASGAYATVGGGDHNIASGTGAAVGGGGSNGAASGGNQAEAIASTIGGGYANWIYTTGSYGTIAGGDQNRAGGDCSVVPGGAANTANGDFSLAAGRRAQANHQGAFVWADATDADFSSTAADQFAVRANGGVAFSTGSAAMTVNGNTVWHAGNDGSSSGLDADLLDGWPSDYYRVFMVTSSTSASTALDGTCRNYSGGQITITAPRAGTVVVEANVRVRLGHVNGTKDALVLNLDTTNAGCYSVYDELDWTIPAAHPSSSSEDYTFTVRRAFNVSAGAHTFYLNGVMSSGGAGDDQFWYARLHATYYPES